MLVRDSSKMLEIFSKSSRILQDSWNKSRTLGGFLHQVVDVGEEVVQPFADIDLCQFAASHKGIDYGTLGFS